jgi:polyisoprenoid-binding protein YceI
MIKFYFPTLFLLLSTFHIAQAQSKYFTKSGKIEFFSKAPLEDIEARNKTAAAVLDSKSGDVQFLVLMKSFEFDKALMQEHFNSDYVESDKYPRSEFKGTIVNNSTVDYHKDGTYPVVIKGKLSLHGVTHDITIPGIITVNGNMLNATSTFNILLSDYKISIPSVVKEKIAKTVRVSVEAKLEELK